MLENGSIPPPYHSSPPNKFSNAPYLESSTLYPKTFHQEYQHEVLFKNPEKFLPPRMINPPNVPSYNSYDRGPPPQVFNQNKPTFFPYEPLPMNNDPRRSNDFFLKRPEFINNNDSRNIAFSPPKTLKKRAVSPQQARFHSPNSYAQRPLPMPMSAGLQRHPPMEFQGFEQRNFIQQPERNFIQHPERNFIQHQERNYQQKFIEPPERIKMMPKNPNFLSNDPPRTHLNLSPMKKVREDNRPPFYENRIGIESGLIKPPDYYSSKFPIRDDYLLNQRTFPPPLSTSIYNEEMPLRRDFGLGMQKTYLNEPRDDLLLGNKFRTFDEKIPFSFRGTEFESRPPPFLSSPLKSLKEPLFRPDPLIGDHNLPLKYGGFMSSVHPTISPPRIPKDFMSTSSTVYPLNEYSFPPKNINLTTNTTNISKISGVLEEKKPHLDTDCDELVEVLKEYIYFERKVQESKENVCRRPDFKLIRLIKEFDDNETGQIVFTEFKNGLKKFGVKAEDPDVLLLVKRYSRDGNNKLDYQEFSHMVLPSSGLNKSSVLSKEEKIEKISHETAQFISKMFKMLLNSQYSCELLRKDLAQKKINLGKAFAYIANLSREKCVKKESLAKFFEKYFFYASKDDIDNLMETFDRNNTGIINENEFFYELTPKMK